MLVRTHRAIGRITLVIVFRQLLFFLVLLVLKTRTVVIQCWLRISLLRTEHYSIKRFKVTFTLFSLARAMATKSTDSSISDPKLMEQSARFGGDF